jgi:glycosyltransferase involved in cell wall biosynthesis
LTQIAFINAVSRSLSYLDFPVDILYGHFLYPSGYSAVHFAKKLGIPSIIACGEAVSFNDIKLLTVEPIGYRKVISDFKQVSGVISVSSLLKEILQSKLKIPEEKVKVFPNGVDLNLFYPRNKYEMRKKYGLPINKIIIIFIGHYDNRKGPQRVLKAVKGLKNIGIVFIGGGNMSLESDNILFKGILKHSFIPEMLSAGDFFVLPTLEEGSCNAIVEALACGLPVITSNGKFNDDIINNEVAIKIDPLNVVQIRNAIIKLINDRELRNNMSLKAVKWASNFDIDIRVRNIVEWINAKIENKKI